MIPEMVHIYINEARIKRGNNLNGYRRFIAYVYEYRNGRKAENCGFIKLEVREGKCTMEIHLHEEKQMEHCSIYGLIRKEGLILGIWLGSLQISRDPAVNVLKADAGNMGDAGVGLDQLCGMILETDTGAFMGTQWDDLPIRPDHFQKLEKKKQTGQNEGFWRKFQNENRNQKSRTTNNRKTKSRTTNSRKTKSKTTSNRKIKSRKMNSSKRGKQEKNQKAENFRQSLFRKKQRRAPLYSRTVINAGGFAQGI